MATSTDVKASTVTASGSVYGARTRVKALSYVAGGTAGSIVLKDGGSGGATNINLATAANGYGIIYIPGDGVLFDSTVYATLTNITSLTVFYG